MKKIGTKRRQIKHLREVARMLELEMLKLENSHRTGFC